MENRLKDLRVKAKLTVRELANLLGVKSASTLTRIELGNTEYISLNLIKQLCDFFNVSPTYLLGYDDDTYEKIRNGYEEVIDNLLVIQDSQRLDIEEQKIGIEELLNESKAKDVEIKLLKEIVLRQAILMGGDAYEPIKAQKSQ